MLTRVLLTFLKIFLLLVVAAMMKFQIPELRYDLGPQKPVPIESPEDLYNMHFGRSTFVSVRGTPDLSKAATFAKHGVRYTYFLLTEYDDKLVVRSPDMPNEEWAEIHLHVGRLRPYHRMPFSRSVRAGFVQIFDVNVPDEAFSLARDDVPHLSGWNIGAVGFAGVLWCVLAYFFFIHGRLRHARSVTGANIRTRRDTPQQAVSGDSSPPHHAQPEPACNQPRNDSSGGDQNA